MKFLLYICSIYIWLRKQCVMNLWMVFSFSFTEEHSIIKKGKGTGWGDNRWSSSTSDEKDVHHSWKYWYFRFRWYLLDILFNYFGCFVYILGEQYTQGDSLIEWCNATLSLILISGPQVILVGSYWMFQICNYFAATTSPLSFTV